MQHQEERPPAYRWVIVGSLTSSVATSLTIIFMLGLLLPEISEDLGLSPSEQGWLGSSVLLANLFLCIPSNLLSSRFRPWRTISLLFLGVGVFTLAQGWSPTLAVLLIGRIGAGLFFTSTQAPRALLVQQWTSRRRLAFTNGVIFAGVDLGMGIGFFLTPLIMDWVGGWRNTLYFWGGISLFLTTVWTVFGRERVTSEFQERMRSQEQTPLLAVLKYPQLWIMGLGMGGAMVAQAGFLTFWPTLAQDELGISATAVGAALGLMTVTAAPTDFLANAVPTLVRRRTLVLAVCGLATTGAYVGLVFSDSTPLTLGLGVLRGASFAFFPVLMIMVFHLPDIKPREVGLGLAFMETCIWIGAGIGPLLVGFLQEATGDLQFALLVTVLSPLILLLTAAVLQSRDWTPARRVPAPATPGHET